MQSKHPALPVWLWWFLADPCQTSPSGILDLWLVVNWSVRYHTATTILLVLLAKHQGQLWGSPKSPRTTSADWESTGALKWYSMKLIFQKTCKDCRVQLCLQVLTVMWRDILASAEIDGTILCLHCPIRWPLVICGYWEFQILFNYK